MNPEDINPNWLYSAQRMQLMNEAAEKVSRELHEEHVRQLQLQHGSVETTYRVLPASSIRNRSNT